MTNDKFILMGLDDERTEDIADAMKSKTCKKILDYLADVKEASEKDIADALKMPINTAEYNLTKLVKSGLVEKTKNFFWSVKGKKIPMYKLARKHIIISPNKNPNIYALKTILPALAIALALIALVVMFAPKSQIAVESQLKNFESQQELTNFVKANSETSYGRYYGEGIKMNTGIAVPTATGTSKALAEASDSSAASDFSTTNIQVEGVDEADFVKNDGKYIYIASGNSVKIIDAYPAENMNILSEINISGVGNIFVNGDKLIIFADSGGYTPVIENCMGVLGESCGGDYVQKSMVYIYDLSDRKNPREENEIEYEGNYFDSRMIGEYVYLISNKYVNLENPVPPVYYANGVEKKIAPSDVHYWDYPETSYVFTSVTAINIKNGNENSKVYLTGYTGTIYVSQDNIYLTSQKTISYEDYTKDITERVYLPLLSESYDEKINKILESDSPAYSKSNEMQKVVNEYRYSLRGEELSSFSEEFQKKLQDFQTYLSKQTEKTVVHKINIDKESIDYTGAGEAPGHILNQFSMDEYKDNFRITTTTGEVWSGNSLNHLYILDKDLKIVGSVEDLAPGEKIYSTRFLGDRAYVVTFKKVDPLFVIDVSNPSSPKVLGYLKITGFSDYLHIYDENHIIGIGKETAAASDEEINSRSLQFAWYQGLKISLFDVSDVNNPIETAKIVIGDRGTDSLALQEHKAFLFDKKKNLLVIPVGLNEIKNKNENTSPNTYGDRVWEGAYVLNIDLDEISVRGKITHFDEYKPKYGAAEDDAIGAVREINGQTWTKTGENEWKINASGYYNYDWSWTDETIDSQEGGVNYGQYFYNYGYQIQRSLYMDDTLYTISNSKVKANNLQTIDEINSLDLEYEEEIYPIYAGA